MKLRKLQTATSEVKIKLLNYFYVIVSLQKSFKVETHSGSELSWKGALVTPQIGMGEE